MNKLPAIDIFCEGNKKVGYGHIRRATTLASQLAKDGISVRILGLRRLLPKPEIIRSSPRVHIFDLPCGNEYRIRDSQSSGHFTVAPDCFGATIPDENIAVYPHSEVLGKKAVYIGFQYILIREDLASYGRATSTHSANNVLIVLGGGDFLNQEQETKIARYVEGKRAILGIGSKELRAFENIELDAI